MTSVSEMKKDRLYVVITTDGVKYKGYFKGLEDGGKWIRLAKPSNPKESETVWASNVASISDEGKLTSPGDILQGGNASHRG